MKKKITAGVLGIILAMSFSMFCFAATYKDTDNFYLEKDSGGGVYNMTHTSYIYAYGDTYRIRVTAVRHGGTFTQLKISSSHLLGMNYFTAPGTIEVAGSPTNVTFIETLDTNGSMAGASGIVGIKPLV